MPLDYDRLRQPVILLKVDGEDADDIVSDMLSITISESNRRLVEVTAVFPIIEPSADFEGSLIMDPRCQPDAIWNLRWGYFDDMAEDVFRVMEFSPDFREDGSVVMSMKLSSRGATMARDTESYSWGNVQTSEIALEIANRYGLYPDIEDSDDRRTRDRAYVQPATVTDLQYLLSLAERINFVCYVENDVLHYHRPATDEAPVLELNWYYGENNAIVRSFKPKIRAPRARTTRAANAHGESSESTDGGRDTSHGGYSIDLVEVRSSRRTASQIMVPEEDRRNVTRRADARQRHLLERSNEGTITTVGQPRLRKNRNVLINGVGAQLSGIWHVHESEHTFSAAGGYSTEAKLRRGAANTSVRNADTEDANPNTHSEVVVAVDLERVTYSSRAARRDSVSQPDVDPEG